jgi:quercetin 2,3-dioxygenase
MPFAIKLTAQDVGEGWLVLEQANAYRGGPPRHIHHDQDEWFYVIEGEYTVEIGGQPHRLGPGDSVLAPREVPHTWALTGQGAGRLLIVFQPAGRMEAFFDEATQLTQMPPYQELRALFTAHGMEIVGPPLEVPGEPPRP